MQWPNVMYFVFVFVFCIRLCVLHFCTHLHWSHCMQYGPTLWWMAFCHLQKVQRMLITGRLEWNVKNFIFKNSDCKNTQSSGSIKTFGASFSLYNTLYIMSMDQKMSQCNLFQLPQKCQNVVAGHLYQYILFSNDPELYNKKSSQSCAIHVVWPLCHLTPECRCPEI